MGSYRSISIAFGIKPSVKPKPSHSWTLCTPGCSPCEGLSQIAPLTKAINYTLAHWSGLTRFLDDGRVEPDTNIVERPIRFIAIGKRNSLFCGDEGGGRTWAILSTLLQTARLNNVDPEVWLIDVLERVVSGATTNDRLAELLAWNWKAAREQTKLAARAGISSTSSAPPSSRRPAYRRRSRP